MNLFTVLFVVLLGLKLMGYIAVSWWVVFAPLVFGFILFAVWAAIIAHQMKKAAKVITKHHQSLAAAWHRSPKGGL